VQLPHPSFTYLADALRTSRRPEGGFDPAGDWTSEYTIIAPMVSRNQELAGIGKLMIERSRTDDGDTKLVINSKVIHETDHHGLKCSLRCKRDELSTLRSWRRVSVMVDDANKPRPLTRTAERTNLSKWSERTGDTKRPVTSNWSLIDALQRLPASGELPTEEFDVLEDLDVPTHRHRLARVDPVEIDVAGRPARLHGYVRFGHGALPVHYWLDEAQRLVLAVSSLRVLFREQV
jgi:hypothetical protein